jgi:hypothetical protein
MPEAETGWIPLGHPKLKKRCKGPTTETMAAPSLFRPAIAVFSLSGCINIPLRPSNQALKYLRSLTTPSTKPFSVTTIRHASHQAQGRANGPKNGAGKRLGAKKTGGMQLIILAVVRRRLMMEQNNLWCPET